MDARLLLGGIKSYLPLPGAGYKGTGGTVTGAYCYAVWLRHLTLIARYLGGAAVPRGTVVELGPGDSIGLGLAAILSGSETYVGLDVLEHASNETNLRVLDELVAIIRAMATWLRPGGVMSHQVDFSGPGGQPWNHHWAYGDLAWRIMRGRRPCYENRVSLSRYVALFEEAGCEVIGVERVEQ